MGCQERIEGGKAALTSRLALTLTFYPEKRTEAALYSSTNGASKCCCLSVCRHDYESRTPFFFFCNLSNNGRVASTLIPVPGAYVSFFLHVWRVLFLLVSLYPPLLPLFLSSFLWDVPRSQRQFGLWCGNASVTTTFRSWLLYQCKYLAPSLRNAPWSA